jgi:phosphohistidine phosphatase SixA
MIIGHNPGFENIVRSLTGKTEAMPTAALAVVDLEINSWKETAAATGKLRRLLRPKEEQKFLKTS